MPANNGGRRSTAPMIVGWSLSLWLFFWACLRRQTRANSYRGVTVARVRVEE